LELEEGLYIYCCYFAIFVANHNATAAVVVGSPSAGAQ